MNWIRLEWDGLNWIRLEWDGLNWIRLNEIKSKEIMTFRWFEIFTPYLGSECFSKVC